MGRELKRVPLDFNWPAGKTWEGYLNPHYVATKCPYCQGGYSPAASLLADKWYGHIPFRPEDRGSKPFDANTKELVALATRNVGGWRGLSVDREIQRLADLLNGQWCHHLNQDDVDALIAADRLWEFTRVPRTEEQREVVRLKIEAGGNSWLPESNGYVPTPDEVNRWSINGFGHDSINCWVCVKAECVRLGEPYSCHHCGGEGDIWPSPESKATYESWVEVEPPKGDGYQLWETVSEGSPYTPVFATPEELATWLVNNDNTVTANTTYDQWMKFITGPGWAPSFVGGDSGLVSGVVAC